jgi:predicted house-cleaning noncanonical NTP pyrophosphatase (MazG superfamily)
MAAIKYNKLVRDRIPQIIRADGKVPVTHVAGDVEYRTKLLEKLLEEVQECFKDPTEDELVDILEVAYALASLLGLDQGRLEVLRREKLRKRGGFTKRIILEETQGED